MQHIRAIDTGQARAGDAKHAALIACSVHLPRGAGRSKISAAPSLTNSEHTTMRLATRSPPSLATSQHLPIPTLAAHATPGNRQGWASQQTPQARGVRGRHPSAAERFQRFAAVGSVLVFTDVLPTAIV